MAGPPDKAALFSIGEFSQVVGLTIKALRFYHDEGILLPALIDPQTGYRYYDPAQIQRARAVAFLRGLGFSVADIKDLLSAGTSGGGDEDRALLAAMQRHKRALRDKVRNLNQIIRQLEHFISQERQAAAMAQATTYDVQEKHLEPMLIGGVRMKGKYSDCGKGFARLGRALGRYIGGKPLLLHYDREYHEDDADFEAAMPLRRQPNAAADGIALRQIPGGRFVSLIHKGPYDQLGHSYARILKFIKEKGYTIAMPTREVYLKGPGMIFKGNPKNYLTEIQILIEGS